MRIAQIPISLLVFRVLVVMRSLSLYLSLSFSLSHSLSLLRKNWTMIYIYLSFTRSFSLCLLSLSLAFAFVFIPCWKSPTSFANDMSFSPLYQGSANLGMICFNLTRAQRSGSVNFLWITALLLQVFCSSCSSVLPRERESCILPLRPDAATACAGVRISKKTPVPGQKRKKR